MLGYRSWLKAGYQVRKGGKGIAIYAPMRFTREDPDTREEHSRTGFRVAYVFDLAQVDPLAGTDTAAFAAHLADTRDAHLANERLKAFLFGHTVELEYKLLAPGLMGYTDGRRITRPDLTTRETEAEAVAYLLCAQLGIAGTDASVEYIRSYRGTPDTLDSSLERIRTNAERLAVELDAINLGTTGRA